MSERKKRDLVFELLEKEWDKRVEDIHRTREIKPEDILTISILTVNRELEELTEHVKKLEEGMATKEDIEKVKDDINTLRWMVGIGFVVVSVIVTVVAALL